MTLVIFTGVFYYLSTGDQKEGNKMRTSLDLLNEIIDFGFDQQKTLMRIDKMVDKELGIGSRKPLSDEELPDVLYDSILGIFEEEAGKNKDNIKKDIRTYAIETIDGKKGCK